MMPRPPGLKDRTPVPVGGCELCPSACASRTCQLLVWLSEQQNCSSLLLLPAYPPSSAFLLSPQTPYLVHLAAISAPYKECSHSLESLPSDQHHSQLLHSMGLAGRARWAFLGPGHSRASTASSHSCHAE